MTYDQIKIVFYGVQAVVMLFGIYGLYEWALALLAKLKASMLAYDKAQLRFGLAALGLALLPVVVIRIFMHLQPFGDGVLLFSFKDGNTVIIIFWSLGLGLVAQGSAIAAFWYASKPYKRAKTPK